MTITKTHLLIIGLVLIAIAVLAPFALKTNFALGAGASPADPSCRIVTNDDVQIGPSNSVQISATSSRRAYLRMQLNENQFGVATSTVFVEVNDAAATLNSPIRMATSTNVVELGINTDFNYTGAVKVITNGAASTTLLVTECVFNP